MEAGMMTLTSFDVRSRGSKVMASSGGERTIEEEMKVEVEEIVVRDRACGPDDGRIPVVEAEDEDGDGPDWEDRDDGPDDLGWEEVYELNDCSPEYY